MKIFVLFLLVIVCILPACKPNPSTTETLESEVDMSIKLTSKSFMEGETIPRKHTCDGENRSPQLSWSGIPEGTKSLALIVDDPDAPMGTWVHWVLFNLDASLTGLEEASTGMGIQGRNSFQTNVYGGPCPPKGKPHRYYFKLYALDTVLNLKTGASKEEVLNAMQGHVLAQGQLMGRYGR